MRSTAIAKGSLFASVASAQVVKWDIERRETSHPKLWKRQTPDGTVEEIITNEKNRGGYFTSTQVGTPGQNLTLQLDTGSSDIWVPSSRAEVCEDPRTSTSRDAQGCTFGSYNQDESDSFNVVLPNQFQIAYVDGSHSDGDYITETFQIGGATLTNVTMGFGRDTDIPYGLCGIGYALNEAIVANSGSARDAYDNLPVQMVNEGLIATNAYSLWLNDLDASTGSLLFGGIDTAKYQGDLSRLTIYPDSRSEAITSFVVALSSLQAVSPSGTDSLSSDALPVPVVLDSGTTFSYLPQDMAEQVWREVGAGYAPEVGVALLPCEFETSKGYFSFGFGGEGGPIINITMDELVLPLTTGDQIPFESGPYAGKDACQFGIQNFTSAPYLLGDTFLRSAYVVYDLENNEIGMAATDFNASETNIVAFPSRGAPIPSSTPAPNQDSIANIARPGEPSFGAADGFNSGTEGASAPLPLAFGWTQMTVLVAGVAFMMF